MEDIIARKFIETIPLDQLSDVKAELYKTKSTNTIRYLGVTVIVLSAVSIVLYLKFNEAKKQLQRVRIIKND